MGLKQYLLVAEADKIQSTLFRATRLAEIIGGSQMLTQWCHDMATEMRDNGVPDDNIIVANGGAFRVVFDSKEECKKWGERLAESYYVTTNGTLSVVTKLLEFETEKFSVVSESGQKELRLIKNNPPMSAATIHNPYIAYCDVCGIGLSNKHNPQTGIMTSRGFVCNSCGHKLLSVKGDYHDKSDGFLGDFIKQVRDRIPTERKIKLAATSEEIAGYDEQKNTAYLVADGNDMGVLFGKCNPLQMKQLSRRLPEIILESVAETTAMVINSMDGADIGFDRDEKKICPVLPLIMGGDDLYIQLATPYALDFARCSAQLFVNKLAAEIKAIHVEEVTPSICMGLIFCKAKFPHSLAYDQAHQLLNMSKASSKQKGKGLSLVAFSRVPNSIHKREHVRTTLQPYNLFDQEVETIIPLNSLLESRRELSEIPSSRLAELHTIYDEIASSDIKPAINHLMKEKFAYFLRRSQKTNIDYTKFLKVITTLGSEDADELYLRNYSHVDETVLGTAIPDLLEYWDYAFKLNAEQEDK